MSHAEPLKLEPLDIDALYDESEKRGSVGECPLCEFNDDNEDQYEEHVLCYVCGVCFKYHHDDYFHDPIMEEPEI